MTGFERIQPSWLLCHRIQSCEVSVLELIEWQMPNWFDSGMESILASAARLLGQSLSDPVDLGGSDRSTVLRARTADGSSVVVKKYAPDAEATAAFTAEASGLALSDYGPRLLAAEVELPMIVMSDLGVHESLADRLLGTQAEPAAAALREWVGAYGRLAAATAGREDELDRLVQKYGRGRRPESDANWFTQRCAEFPRLAAAFGAAGSSGLEEELAGLAAVAQGGRFPVFSPGDICPDNNLLTPQGLRVLDFEGASFHSVFLDAAYARMPFATCWCVFRLPAGLAEEIEECYRAEVVGTYPELGDDLVWRPGVRSAVALWTVAMSTFMMAESKEGDSPMHPTRRPSASVRQVLRHRWSALLAELEPEGELPALTECVRTLLRVASGWPVEPLPYYPAFGG